MFRPPIPVDGPAPLLVREVEVEGASWHSLEGDLPLGIPAGREQRVYTDLSLGGTAARVVSDDPDEPGASILLAYGTGVEPYVPAEPPEAPEVEP